MSLIEEGIEYILCNWQSLVDLLEYNPAVRSYVNAWLINTAVAKAPFRPYTLSTLYRLLLVGLAHRPHLLRPPLAPCLPR